MNSELRARLWGHDARKFEAADISGLRLREEDEINLRSSGLPPETLADLWAESGGGLTLLKDEIPVAAGGVLISYPGVGVLWFVGSETLASSWASRRAMLKLVRGMIPYLMRSLGLRRVEARVRIDNKKASRFVEYLGFIAEGEAEKFFADGAAATLFGYIGGGC